MTMQTPPGAPQLARGWPPEQGQWTYEDWLRLPDDGFRYEILNGELFVSPPPNISHQTVVGNLFALMLVHAKKNRLGRVFQAPTGVRLPGQGAPVQPDILFVSGERKGIIGKEYVDGAPDLVVEVLSPSNWPFDRNQKFQAYRDAGVKEYWIVDYRAKKIEVFVLEEGTYALIGQYGQGETVRSGALVGFEAKVDEILAE